ncbi:MAG: adenylosuccinate lyase [Candidatus Thermoplasmatota archaeon]|nr:adenylosuccinate lyase [Candidatus Thermoplasmatota archaeon]
MESVCPLDFRYGREEMKRVLSHESRVRRCLDVEASLARALAAVGRIPPEAAREITLKAKLEYVTIEKVNEVEARIRHDVMAIVKVLSDACEGDAGKYVHLGATSYDIVDTALALQMKDALEIIRSDLKALERALIEKASENRDLVMVGRTHGQFAIPLTLGFKFAVWLAEVHRHIMRIEECRKRVLVGKVSGAVGTGAALGEESFEVERLVMEDLGLLAEEGATQIVQRDRQIEILCHLANLSVTVEKMSTEIRTLQRPEIGELMESFDSERQVGSSTMSHKRNPITCENVTGLARVLRSFLTASFEGGVQWNERDLSNSSAERFILPHMLVLADEILVKITSVMENLVIDREAIERNLNNAGSVIMAESVIMALVSKGMGRQEAHEITRQAAMEHYRGMAYKDALLKDGRVMSLLRPEELERSLTPSYYTGTARDRVDRIIASVRSP